MNRLTSIAIVATLLSGSAAASPLYFRSLDVPGAFDYTRAQGLNDGGLVVGVADGHGFLYDGATYSTFVAPGSIVTWANDINNSGVIVGEFRDHKANDHGFVMSGGVFTTVDVPGAVDTGVSRANDVGMIVGTFDVPEPGGGLGVVPHGFTEVGGLFTTVDVPGSFATTVNGVNDSGDLVGVYYDASGEHSYLRQGGAFSTIDPYGSNYVVATAINNAGVIVGTFAEPDDSLHGFIDNGGVLTTFLLGTGAFPTDINNAGVLAGWYSDPYGQKDHGFISTTAPEPGSWALMISGFGLIGLALRRRTTPRARAPALPPLPL